MSYADTNDNINIDFTKNLIVLFRNSGQTSYFGDVYIKNVKKYLLYTEISIESNVLSGDCNIDNISRAPFRFISIPRNLNTMIFNESVSLKSCNGENVTETFKEISFREVDLNESQFILQERLEVIQH